MPTQAIKKTANALRIPYLVHFTRTSNLTSIIEHGLQPRTACKNLGLKPVINDNLRLDGRENGISLSISHPNGPMLYKLRKENPDEKWVILAISTKILWEKNVLFCKHNAADARISNLQSTTLALPESFAGMFDNFDHLPSRSDQCLRDFDPTDVQAEVLVMDPIEPHHVLGAAFNTKEMKEEFSAILGSRQQIVSNPNKGLFAERTYRRKYG